MQHTWLKKFTVIWTGQFISSISSSAVNFAIIIWLSLETGSAEILAYATICGLLPQAIIGPFAGVYVDRWNKKWTIIYSDLLVAVFTTVMAVSFYFGYQSLLLIYGVLVFRSVATAFHMPAMQALTPMLAPQSQILRVEGIHQMIQSVSGIAGPALGALIISILPIDKVLILDVIGAVFAISLLLIVKIDQKTNTGIQPATLKKVIQEMKAGINVIVGDKGLLALFCVSIAMTFFMMPISPLLPLITLIHFQGGKFEIGLIEIWWSIGMLVGSIIVTAWKPRLRSIIIINLVNILTGISLSLAGLVPSDSFLLFVGLIGFSGVTYSIESTYLMAIMQRRVKQEVLGRVFSIYFSVAILPSMIGLMATGFLADRIGINQVFVIIGVLATVIGGISFLVPSLMVMDKDGKT